MSAIGALKGYRTQFLYSLHYILSNIENDFIYRLEGEEDLDILDNKAELLFAIQLKNLDKTLTLSDILSTKKTSFIKRFLNRYNYTTPVLVSYSKVSDEIKNWNINRMHISTKDKSVLQKYNIPSNDWLLVKEKLQIIEVDEETIAEEVQTAMKEKFPEIDPVPTIGYLLNWLQFIAEKQRLITTKEFYSKIEDFAQYLSERIAIHNQYGLILKPLHKITIDDIDTELAEKEFFTATFTRYEHILLGFAIKREEYLSKIKDAFRNSNIIIVRGASGQGKTTLAYNYTYIHVNDLLTYELKVLQDPIATQSSILALAAIAKKLDIPTAIIINVSANSTEWVHIVKESAHLKHLLFVITIRNEDWYRAIAKGIDFEHQEINLELSKEEAEVIYSRLNKRKKINDFADFEEAWIRLGENPPLLEFVYSITQGDSLHNRLNQQIQQILSESDLSKNYQIELLRIISITDSFGAKIDISKLDNSIDFQFVIEKLENEFLIKKTLDKKFITGLHMVRSLKLKEILFDEFINTTEEYCYKCINLIAAEDLYLFLLQAFYYNIFDPKRFIKKINDIDNISWATYTSIIKALIWAGIRDYVEDNRMVIDLCNSTYGEAWSMFLDTMFEMKRDESLLSIIDPSNSLEKHIDELNNQLRPRKNIFKFAHEMLNKIDFPSEKPNTLFAWKSFGEALFWAKNIGSQDINLEIYSDSDFKYAFQELDSKSLSKLMLGMFSYSPKLNSIRVKYVYHFIEKIKIEFDILHLSIDTDTVSINYIYDILKDDNLDNDNTRITNSFVVSVLEILRTGLPDKNKFISQGHGHRLLSFGVAIDDTHKEISVDNLPLEEWTKINSCIINLYNYNNRPKDWIEYSSELNQWEILIGGKLKNFTQLFTSFFNGNVTDELGDNVLKHRFAHIDNTIKAPKLITEPLGIYNNNDRNINKTSYNQREAQNKRLFSKYERLFKSHFDFKIAIENFILQSSQTVYSILLSQVEKEHIHNELTEDLSQKNLFDAINKLYEFNTQYAEALKNIDASHKTKIEPNTLISTAVLWKDFISNNRKADHSLKRILKLKSDFETKINKICKSISVGNPFTIQYVNNTITSHRPVLIINGKTPFNAFVGMKEAYTVVHNAIDTAEFASLKYLMLSLSFSKIYFIQTVEGKSINKVWNEMDLFTIRGNAFDTLTNNNLSTITINDNILERLYIPVWSQLHPEFNDISVVSSAFNKINLLTHHFNDLHFFETIKLNDSEQSILNNHVNKVGLEIKESLKIVLESLVLWFKMFPLDKEEYEKGEEEYEYFQAILNIEENIFPEPRSENNNYQFSINMKIVSEWIIRLQECSKSWGIFLVLLYDKYINKYHKQIL